MKLNWILPLLLLFTSFQLYPSTGKIVFLKGEVTVKEPSNTSYRKAKKNQKLNIGDMVRTKKGSLVVIALDSGSKIKLNEDSALTLQTEKTDKKPESLFLNSGSVFISVLKNKLNVKKKPKIKLRLNTRTASMGVRGTQFFASFGKQKNQAKRSDLWMCVNEGLVEVETKKTKKAILVKEGEGVKIAEGTNVSEPKPLAWTKNLNWEFDSAKGDLTNKVSIEEAYVDLLDKEYE